MHQHVFIHPAVVRMNDDTLGNDKCVRRRAILRIDAVQLEAGRAAAHITAVSEHRAGVHIQPRGHERNTRIANPIDETIREPEVAALRREVDADKLVTRTADAPPQSAIAATERMVALARHRLPHTDAAFGAADFQRVGLIL